MKSPALNKFKKELGQANHMLITIMIGLDGIISNDLEPNTDFHTSWNPKSKKDSVERAKVYAKKSMLAWAVDCIDMYLQIINTKPFLINQKLREEFDKQQNSKSARTKLLILINDLNISTTDSAMVDLLICWRNRLIHYNATNDITINNRNILKQSAEQIKKNHCGLDITKTLNSFDKNDIPTFKEVTSFIKSSISLITKIDEILCSKLDLLKYSDEVLICYFKENPKSRLNNIFSKDLSTKKNSINFIFHTHSLDSQNPKLNAFYRSIVSLNYAEATAKLKSDSFL